MLAQAGSTRSRRGQVIKVPKNNAGNACIVFWHVSYGYFKIIIYANPVVLRP